MPGTQTMSVCVSVHDHEAACCVADCRLSELHRLPTGIPLQHLAQPMSNRGITRVIHGAEPTAAACSPMRLETRYT